MTNNQIHRDIIRFLCSIKKARYLLELIIIFVFLLLASSTLVFSQPMNWQRVYKGYNNLPVSGYNIVNADNDNYFLLGMNEYSVGTIIYKINNYGDTIFSRYFQYLIPTPIVNDGLGNVIFAVRNHNLLAEVIKISSDGQTMWDYIYTNSAGAQFWDIIRTSDNFYIICGRMYNFGYVLKISNSGEFIWQKIFPSTNIIIYNSLLETVDNGYLLGGYIKDSLGTSTITQGLLTKIDSSGNKIWEKRYLTPDSLSGVRDLRIVKHKEGYIMGGQIWDSLSKSYIMFNKIDINGNIKYSRTFPSFPDYDYYFADVKTISDNRILFIYNRVPYINFDSTISEVLISDTIGNIVRTNTYTGASYIRLNRIFVSSPNSFMFSGTSNHLFGYAENAILIKTDTMLYAPPVSIKNISTTNPEKFSLRQNYPNPFNSTTQIEFEINKRGQYSLKIYDVSGKLISELFNQTLEPGEYKTDFNASNYSSGVYFYKLESSSSAITKKLVLLK